MHRLPNRLAIASVILAVVIGLTASSLADNNAEAEPTTTVATVVAGGSGSSAGQDDLLFVHLDDAPERIGDLQRLVHEEAVITQLEAEEAAAAQAALEAEQAAAAQAKAEADAKAAAEAAARAQAEAQAAIAAVPPPAAPQPSGPPAPPVAQGSVWDRLAQCETGGNWATNSVPGFSGGLGFANSSWDAFGGRQFTAYAWQASRDQQIVVAERILAAVGWRAWPGCTVKLGLR